MTAFDHWSAGTVGGHADELAVLAEHAPECVMAEACMSEGAPAVIGLEHGRLVVVWTGRQPVWGTGRCEVRVDGPSASLRCGPLSATHVPVPYALSVQVLANGAGPGDRLA